MKGMRERTDGRMGRREKRRIIMVRINKQTVSEIHANGNDEGSTSSQYTTIYEQALRNHTHTHLVTWSDQSQRIPCLVKTQ